MRLLSVTVFFIAWANVIRTQYLIPNKRDSIYLTSTMVGAILNLIINWMLIPKYQANGAAFWYNCCGILCNVGTGDCSKNELPMRKYIMSYSPILVIGFIMAVLVDRIGVKLGVSISTLALQILAGGFFFCIATIAYLRISNDELWRLGINSISKKKKE